jgi:hypothetical protein
MTATTASDESGVEYYFECTMTGGHDSGWQSNPSYTDTGLSPETTYTYRVKARDLSFNQNETGYSSSESSTTDAGGVGWTPIIYDDFESGFGNWIDGGTDCLLYTSGTYAYQGNAAINLQDNTSTSVMSTNNLALSAYTEVKVDFAYRAQSMDNSKEDFWLQISTNGGSSYTTVKSWVKSIDFENGLFYTESVTITGYNLTDQTRLRFRCDASGNIDDVYIDVVDVSAQ